MNDILNLSTEQLRRVVDIKEKIESLQAELSRVLGGGAAVAAVKAPGKRRTRGMSAAGRARIIAAQKARWAKYHSSKGTATAATGRGPRRKLSAAARSKIAAAARARWAKAKAAGKTRL
ncbi:MAG: hypothetical protein ACRED1_15810 [Limisphaerales bacterium]